MNSHKTDSEYGANINLEPNRTLVPGYQLDTLGCTDIEALQQVISSYIDTSSIDNILGFTRYKVDFAVSFLDSMYLILNDKYKSTLVYYDEVDKQLADITHRITKRYLSGRNIDKEEKLSIYDEQEIALVNRRQLKDSLTIMKILMENIEKSRNFIICMNKRQYSPKSERFKDDPNYHISKENDGEISS